MEGLPETLSRSMERINRMRAKGSDGSPPKAAAANSNATSDPDVPKCPYGLCNGSGAYGKTGDDGKPYGVVCECLKLTLMQSQMKFAAIPEEFGGLRVSDFDTGVYTGHNRKTAEAVKKMAIGYVNKFEHMKAMGRGLYLYGEAKGSGKTRMAVSIGNALIRQHRQTVRFITTVNFLNEIKSTFNGSINEDGFSKLLEAAKTVDVLILDDLGVERPTDWVGEMFYAVLNDRMVGKMVTIFTSNCRVEELRHDARLVDRILRMAMPIKFPDESVRLKFAKSENEQMLKMLMEN